MRITDIERGKGGRCIYIYARLQAPDGTYPISATLDYIIGACLQRGYVIENWEEIKKILGAEFALGIAHS